MSTMNLGGTIRINRTGIAVIIGIGLIFIIYNLHAESNYKTPEEQRSRGDIVNLNKLLIAAIEASRLGGIEVVKVSKEENMQIQLKGKTKEGADDRVTIADFKSHCVMYKGLKKLFPKVKVISEEDPQCNEEIDLTLNDNVFDPDQKNLLSDTPVEASRLTIWIDPLDATQEYTEKLYQYVTTMVCVAKDGKPIIGVIHNPFKNTTSWAWVGRIASKDLQLTPGKSDVKLKPKIVISRSHAGDVESFLKKAFDENVDIVKAAGAGYKVLEVAHGSATAYIHMTSIKKWDLCAGNAIIEYIANGQMTTFDNIMIDYSDGRKVVNDKKVVATIHDHEMYIQAIQATLNKT